MDVVRFCTLKGKDMWFETGEGSYVLHGAVLHDWRILLAEHSFVEVDRGTLANMRLAKVIDTDLRLLYFDDPPASCFCTVSQSKMRVVPYKYPHLRTFESGYETSFS
ncbi:hypothetical protein DUZ99_15725 [Xylanibacillus composti]|nr:hypothetical protein [Xylanibacillus composti]